MASRLATFSLSQSRLAKPSCALRVVVARAEDDTVNKVGEPAQSDTTPIQNETPKAVSAPSFGSLMAVDGPIPELVNGRLAMLGFLAALGAEIGSGEGVLAQLGDAPTPVLITMGVIAIASFVPLLKGIAPEARALGPLNANAERYNGRAAMIGLVALVGTEIFLGGRALF